MEEIKEDVSTEHNFQTPRKLVKSVEDMKIWDKSSAYHEYMGFVLAINEAIKGHTNTSGAANASESINKVCDLLDKLDKLIDETPPIEQPQRFGNQSFRMWYNKLKDGAIDYLQEALPEHLHRAIPEIMIYLIDGFGNATRIDYGTGHEISFIMFMCCLFKIEFLKKNDEVAVACKVFVKYLDIARKLQQTYRMEPAGSQGVWSLDDYQFVPFIWGSSQLSGPKPQLSLESTAFLNENVVERYHTENMFLTCIKYINQVKKGPFAEHSNQLWSISGVSSWTRINSGLIKMYKAEVLSKFPLVQHIVFGSLFTLTPIEENMTTRMPNKEEQQVRKDLENKSSDEFKVPSAVRSTNI